MLIPTELFSTCDKAHMFSLWFYALYLVTWYESFKIPCTILTCAPHGNSLTSSLRENEKWTKIFFFRRPVPERVKYLLHSQH
jgi:hypothetical protein